MGIIIGQYKDPYKPISIMECNKGFFRGSSDFLKQFWQVPMLVVFWSGIIGWQEMFNIHSTLRDERVQQSGYEVGAKAKTCPNWRYPLEDVPFLRVVTVITWFWW